MAIILEGFDNCGKTTLGKMLSEQLGVEVIHSIKPRDAAHHLETVHTFLTDTSLAIRDRCCIFSEMVYGPVVRDAALGGKDSWKHLVLLLARGPLVIYCRPPESEIFKFGDREQMGGVIEHSKRLLERYDSLFEAVEKIAPNDLEVYDWTQHRPGWILNRAKSYFNEQRHFQSGLAQLEKAYQHILGEST